MENSADPDQLASELQKPTDLDLHCKGRVYPGLDKSRYHVSLNFLHKNGGASNDYPQHMFLWRNKKNINTIFGLEKSILSRAMRHHTLWNLIFVTTLFAQICLSKYYRIYPKYSDTSTPYHICSKIWTSTIHYPMLCLKIAGWVANSVDPDETPRSAASHLGLYCLLRPVCLNTYGKYGIFWNWEELV